MITSKEAVKSWAVDYLLQMGYDLNKIDTKTIELGYFSDNGYGAAELILTVQILARTVAHRKEFVLELTLDEFLAQLWKYR